MPTTTRQDVFKKKKNKRANFKPKESERTLVQPVIPPVDTTFILDVSVLDGSNILG